MRKRKWSSALLAASAIIAAAGCGSDDPGTVSGSEVYDTCTTSIADNVPAFYKTYFRCVTITMSGDTVVIKTDGLPPHNTYYYGSGHDKYVAFDFSKGSDYHPNPNTLKQQNVTIQIPAAPKARGLTINAAAVDAKVNSSSNEYGLGPRGVALDGVSLFNPLAAPGDDIEDEKYTFDPYNAHPTNNGAYHYHTTSKGPLELLKKLGKTTNTTPGQAEIEVYGMMCDGTLLLGCKELDGSAPAAGLDSQNGHVHDIKDKAGTVHFTGRYHTHVCTSIGSHKYTPEIQYYDTCK
ncbi:MAG: YHYH protein [Myxococcales bacterium]|nr:YHYH protein [Myxococcales bacterium]